MTNVKASNWGKSRRRVRTDVCSDSNPIVRAPFGATWITALVLAGLVALGCSDGLDSSPIAECPDNQALVVAVAADPAPVITWNPTCGVAGLEVRPTGSASGGWSIMSRTAQTNSLPSGIHYGQLPPEGRTVISPSPLVSGAEYEAVVSRWRFDAIPGEPSPALLAAGSATFVAR
jgi:hypothetical protein